jgi:hypothetical protein
MDTCCYYYYYYHFSKLPHSPTATRPALARTIHRVCTVGLQTGGNGVQRCSTCTKDIIENNEGQMGREAENLCGRVSLEEPMSPSILTLSLFIPVLNLLNWLVPGNLEQQDMPGCHPGIAIYLNHLMSKQHILFFNKRLRRASLEKSACCFYFSEKWSNNTQITGVNL